jgi:hypothetical protein
MIATLKCDRQHRESARELLGGLKGLTLRWKIEIRRIQGFHNSCFERRQTVGHRIPKRNRIDAVILMT